MNSYRILPIKSGLESATVIFSVFLALLSSFSLLVRQFKGIRGTNLNIKVIYNIFYIKKASCKAKNVNSAT